MGIIFYDALKFNQFSYHSQLSEWLLNENAEFVKWGAIKNYVPEHDIFVKPASDQKFFKGQVFYSGTSIVDQLHASQMIDEDLYDDEYILINEQLVNLYAEFRIFVIDNKIVDLCQTHFRHKVDAKRRDDAYPVIEQFVSQIMRLYKPNDHYVIDVGVLNNGRFKVIEYNCLNCSGFYAIDRSKVFKAIANLKHKRPMEF